MSDLFTERPVLLQRVTRTLPRWQWWALWFVMLSSTVHLVAGVIVHDEPQTVHVHLVPGCSSRHDGNDIYVTCGR